MCMEGDIKMKMKRIAIGLLMAGVAMAMVVLSTGCASTRIKRLSGAEFANQVKHIDQISSFHWTTYVGRSDQRAYLEHRRPSLLYNIVGKRTVTTVYWAEISELPPGMSEQLKKGPLPDQPE